jgi:hypothetical protein
MAPRRHMEEMMFAQRSHKRQVPALVGRWLAVLLRPGVRTFEAQRPAARWATVWSSVAAQGIVEGAGVAALLLGPGAGEGVSSLPVGPKLHLPSAPLWLGLVAFAGSVAQFFLFSGLLFLSARRFGGHGSFLTQAYLIALFWVPLMVVSAATTPFGTAGSVVGVLARVYALILLGPALAAAHRLPLARAWMALLVVGLGGLLLGLVVLTVAGARLSGLVK